MRSLRGHPHTLWIGVMAAGLVLGSTLPVWAATGLSYTGETPIYKTVSQVVPRYKTETVRVPQYATETVEEPVYTEETTVKPDGQMTETQVQTGTEPVSESVVVGYTHKTKKVRDGTKTIQVQKIVGYTQANYNAKYAGTDGQNIATLDNLANQTNMAADYSPLQSTSSSSTVHDSTPVLYVSTSNYETALAESEGLQVVQVGGSGAAAALKIANAQVVDGADNVVILGGSQTSNVNTEVLAQNLAAQNIADGDAVTTGQIVQIGGNDVYDTLAGAVTYNALAAQSDGGGVTLTASTLNALAASMENENYDNSKNANDPGAFSGVNDSQYSSQTASSTAGTIVMDSPSSATSPRSGEPNPPTSGNPPGSGNPPAPTTPTTPTTGLLAVTPYTGDPGTAVALTGTAMDNDATSNLGTATWYNLGTGLFYATPLTVVSAGTDYATTVPEAPAGTYAITLPNTSGTVGFALTAPPSGTPSNPTLNTVDLTGVSPSTGADGITVTLTATVTGTPPTTVTWLNATTGQTVTSGATESNATTYTTVVPTLPDGNYAIALGNSNSIGFTVVTACSTAHPGYLENDGTLTPAFTQCDTLVIPLTSENNTGAALALQAPPPAVTPVAPSAATALIAQGSPVQCREVRMSWWPTWLDWAMGPQHMQEQCEIVRHDPWQTPEQNTPY